MKVELVSSSTFFPLAQGVTLIGRWDPDKCAYPEIDLDEFDTDAQVSRKHAMITLNAKNELWLEDLGSRNGTFLRDGTRLIPGNPARLLPGDEFLVGKLKLKIHSS